MVVKHESGDCYLCVQVSNLRQGESGIPKTIRLTTTTRSPRMEVGTDKYGLHTEVTLDDEWIGYHLGNC